MLIKYYTNPWMENNSTEYKSLLGKGLKLDNLYKYTKLILFEEQ